MNREQDDDLVFLTYQPGEGWTPDQRFNIPVKRTGRQFRVDVITQEIVPLTDEQLSEIRNLRQNRVILAWSLGVAAVSVALIALAVRVLGWF